MENFKFGQVSRYETRSFEHRAQSVLKVEHPTLGTVTHYYCPSSKFNHAVVFYPAGNRRFARYYGQRHNPNIKSKSDFEAYVVGTVGE